MSQKRAHAAIKVVGFISNLFGIHGFQCQERDIVCTEKPHGDEVTLYFWKPQLGIEGNTSLGTGMSLRIQEYAETGENYCYLRIGMNMMPYSANFGTANVAKVRDELQRKHELCQKLLTDEMGFSFEVDPSDAGKGVVVLYKRMPSRLESVLFLAEIITLETCIRSVLPTLSGYGL